MLEVRVIRACTGHFRYRVPPASRGRQEPPQAVEFLPWDALGPLVCGEPGGPAGPTVRNSRAGQVPGVECAVVHMAHMVFFDPQNVCIECPR